MDIIPDKRKLITLVEQAHEGKLCLPNFQRDFVWTREEVADLLRSLVRQYFIGSLLLLRTAPDNPPFSPVFLRGAKPVGREPRPELLVLDGQQRLTSLIYAMTAPDLPLKDSRLRRWFFLDLNLLLNDPDNDEVVFDRSVRDLNGLNDDKIQWQQRLLPCTALLRQGQFLRWRDGLDDYLREREPVAHEQFRASWRDTWTSAVTGVQEFMVPLVELPQVDDSDAEAIGRVCAIFEKLNSTGVDLSVYDLLTARLYRSGIRLHDLWKSACRSHERIRMWSGGKADQHKFGVLVLRTLALLRKLDPKPRILINLAPEQFEEDWNRAAAAIERALKLLELVERDGFGVFHRKWLPGYGLIPILAALRAHIEDSQLGESARADLRRWYWCNVFLERYSSAVESKSRKDFSEFISYWAGSGDEPSVFQEARARLGGDGYTIRDSASYASAVYSGVFCLLARRGARDWKLGESIQLQELNDHHIFPRKYLHRHGIDKRAEVNTIVNRTLISDRTNKAIRDKAPAAYLDQQDAFEALGADDLLEKHFIGPDAGAAMRRGDEGMDEAVARSAYDAFLAARERAIISEIRAVCGVRDQG